MQRRAHVQSTSSVPWWADGEYATFLMQATFGPTVDSLKIAKRLGFKQWLKKEFRKPVELHRAFYRERVNPHYSADAQSAYMKRSPCAKGSRWRGFVFTRADIKQRVLVKDSKGSRASRQILVANNWRTDIDPKHVGNGLSSPVACSDDPHQDWSRKGWKCNQRSGDLKWRCSNGDVTWTGPKVCQQSCFDVGNRYPGDDCSSGWAAYMSKNFNGYICSVEEAIGGLVAVSSSAKCTSLSYMLNPAIWIADPSESTTTDLAFETSVAMPGVVFLSQESLGCNLARRSFIKSEAKFYCLDERMELSQNTLASPSQCVAPNFLNEGGCQLQPSDAAGDCAMLCGSPGEVANEPREGHLMSMFTSSRKEYPPNRHFDNRYYTRQSQNLGKSIVWTMKALRADDQLRQRMAWSLSQIFVVGAPGFGEDNFNEMWISYYDIFVRNAVGQFRDVLREVTYSPLMGSYLTFTGSKSYDASQSYPDENYAREIMQLFTIGLYKLHPNGSRKVRVVGNGNEDLPTYDNEQIMNFARVFTGFQHQRPRGNIEVKNGNWIDPMRVNGLYHDVYPKPDLDGNFLGDGYPLCTDLPQHAWLAKGAAYVFKGYTHGGQALVLDKGSKLLAALCGSGQTCMFRQRVTLQSNVKCQDQECDITSPGVVKVPGGFFQYVTPPCVYHFFANGRKITRVRDGSQTCADPLTPAAGVSCCAGCTNLLYPSLTKKGITCENAEEKWLKRGKPLIKTRCNKHKGWRKLKWCEATCAKLGLGYQDSRDCSKGAYRQTVSCSSSWDRVTFPVMEKKCNGLEVCSEKKCSWKDWGNYAWTKETCSMQLQVHGDGKVSAQTDFHSANRFAVPWGDLGAPSAGTYDAVVEARQVFDAVPDKDELLSNLRVGAWKPTVKCTASCSGEVKAYSPRGNIDIDTVFESRGRFFKNAVHTVQVGSDGHEFRNPPVFIRPGIARQSAEELQQAALAEVESLLDHLVEHDNTPVFIGKKLIQRFVSSNPSPDYVAAVAGAFMSGTYADSGITHSGKRGDLGATLAAVLLHPEARSQASPTDGLLREPMLKLVHFMRSMEYADNDDQQIVFKQLQNVIGQFPYQSPTVFNYFDAMFMPARLGMRPEPEPESEPEPEPEPEELVAPEFEIFTPPLAINLVNGINSLVSNGVSHCEYGFGAYDGNRFCNRGTLEFTEEVTAAETLELLNILLTGGRLTPQDAEVVRTAYEEAADSDKLSVAQQAIMLTPEFHNLGTPLPNGTRPDRPPKPDKAKPDSYKAVVLLFLAGGADTFHMLVPIGCKLYQEYAEVRKGVVHAEDKVHPLSSKGQPCKKFGLHPALPFLADRYERVKDAAFVSNVGALVEPITHALFKSGRGRRCRGMFSHSDQQAAAQTLQCQIPGFAPKGAGGRIADELAMNNFKTTSFSINGKAIWSEGFDTDTEILDSGRGAIRLDNYGKWEPIIQNITRQVHRNIYCEEYAKSFADAINSSETFGRVLDKVELKTTYVADTKLAKQLHQVARLIATRGDRKAERDLFVVKIGGFDTHSGVHEKLNLLFQEIDAALAGFVDELEKQGVWKNTVLLSESDFGRTLRYNGLGTDHGWGGNHFVLGGAVKGGHIFNRYVETFVPGNDYDAGRGRVIPKYPWESMMVPIAEWLGAKDLSKIFPNLGNFNRSSHIIDTADLFDKKTSPW